MKKLTFATSASPLQAPKTRRQQFLADINHIVPWKQLCKRVAPYYQGPQDELEMMLRISLLQQWYALTDIAMEEALRDMPIMSAFAGTSEGWGSIPSAKAIQQFGRLLEDRSLGPDIEAVIASLLSQHGLLLRRGAIVEAALDPTFSTTASGAVKSADSAPDGGGRRTLWYFGAKRTGHSSVNGFAIRLSKIWLRSTLLHFANLCLGRANRSGSMQH